MEASYLERKVKKSWAYQYRFPLLIAVIVITVILTTFSLGFHAHKDKLITNPDFIYNTWKVEKIYKNGKLVINSNKYHNLFFQVNRDGTAEWWNDTQRLKVNFTIAPDGSQIIMDDGLRVEDVETVFELRPNVLRFGKRNINTNSHYEYVFTAIGMKGGNIF